ncbi:MAG: serine/threonine protein kinase, partial [bacterium]|nr:serine/threonine protein kinase [bacterium]
MSSTDAKLKQTDFRLCTKCDKLHTGATTCPECTGQLTLIDHTYFIGKSFGKYKIEQILGVGGMGIVFQGIHQTLGKKVAIKIFIPGMQDTSFEKRFLREARILAALKHPNLVEVYDFDISSWGPPYYVMEFLEGKTMREEMESFPNGIPPHQFGTYLEPIINGLSHAHKKGIVHRDLKPDNIFIEVVQGKKIIKILDFGIAKSIKAESDDGANLTATQTVLGTPFYLTPEQILNKNIGP